jgi:hypothetical protein
MKNAKLFTFEVDIHLQCPSCELFFRYRNSEIPSVRSVVHHCEGCEEELVIPPFFIDVHPKKKKKKQKMSQPFSLPERGNPPKSVKKTTVQQQTNDIINSKEAQEATSALESLGYKKKEAESQVKSVYHTGMSAGDLINKVLGTQ